MAGNEGNWRCRWLYQGDQEAHHTISGNILRFQIHQTPKSWRKNCSLQIGWPNQWQTFSGCCAWRAAARIQVLWMALITRQHGPSLQGIQYNTNCKHFYSFSSSVSPTRHALITRQHGRSSQGISHGLSSLGVCVWHMSLTSALEMWAR